MTKRQIDAQIGSHSSPVNLDLPMESEFLGMRQDGSVSAKYENH